MLKKNSFFLYPRISFVQDVYLSHDCQDDEMALLAVCFLLASFVVVRGRREKRNSRARHITINRRK